MVRLSLAAVASAAILPALLATSAQAQSYGARAQHVNSYENCVREQRNRQVAGAVIGGILGAVVGAEIHDDRQDRAREDRRYRDRYGYRRDRGYRHHRGHRGRHHRGHHNESGNDGAVLAGAGLGAVAGAAVAGRGNNCDHLRHQSYGYSQHGYSQGGYNQGGYYVNDNNGGGGNQYASDDGYYYEGPAQYSYDTEGYGTSSSSQVLVGGEDYRLDNRNYSASSVSVSTPATTGACRDMRSGNGAVVLMCQGVDGIWRPAR